ncbi:MAG: hypothetical protein JST91_20305 [Actinobacteria bacterium]|nr:hypothetical protein [Actinomycetota bacterium]
MATHWTQRFSRFRASFVRAPRPYPPDTYDRDADRRRASSDLDAIRARFPDHA